MITLSRTQQTYSVKGQLINILGFAGYIQSLLHILLCMCRFFHNALKNTKPILSSRAIQKEGHRLYLAHGPYFADSRY